MLFVNTFCRYTQLNEPKFLFLSIQFRISQMVPSIAMYS